MKLTKELLKKLVKEESAKFGAQEDVEDRVKDTEETDADEYADSTEKHIDFMHALKIEEARLKNRLAKISEQKKRTLRLIKSGK